MNGEEFSLVIKDHVAKSRSANMHPAKLLVLSSLLKELFSVRLEELIPGVETKLGSKLWGLRGSADLIFSNVVFEIKVDLKVDIDDAQKKLVKYFQVLHEKEPGRKHVGIATDVIEFVAYMPAVKGEQVVGLNRIGSVNIAEASSAESVLWLDSFVFSKPKIRPSAMDLRWRFGPDSPTYCVSVDGLTALWEEVKDEKDVALKLDLWTKNMEIVYGGRPEVLAFLDHTYLVTLVKLIVYLRLSGDNLVREDRLIRALTGEYFSSYGIANLIEEDFFAWILHPKIGARTLKLVADITRELMRYDLSQIDEDFFKEIYQEIVKRSERHRIGEYYTPEWLVQLTLQESMALWGEKNQGFPRILDPACGSGTFLCNAIHKESELLSRSGKTPDQVLDFILSNIVGVDVNPLATVVARANYLVALGELLQLGKPIIIPVYVADSIQVPKVLTTLAPKGGVTVYEVDADGHPIQIPKSVIVQKAVLGQIFEAYKDAVAAYRTRAGRNEALELLTRASSKLVSANEFEVLKSTLNTILTLMEKGLDSIWVFVLNNIYAPILLMESKFDIVIGNPPWISMMYIENEKYQDFMKEAVLTYELLNRDQVQLFANMEIASLFFCKTSDLYLKDDGIIAFVMPRSVLTGALHHVNFKQFQKPKHKLLKVLDLEDVSPLFNVPSCVLIAKRGQVTTYPVLGRKLSGELPEKNVRLVDAIKQLSIKDYSYKPLEIPTTRSWYYGRIREGAPLRPRSLWFIDFDVHPVLGVNALQPSIRTSKDVLNEAKDRWKGIELQGSVEAEFIYETSLGRDIAHFCFRPRPVILPVEPTSTSHRLLSVRDLRNRGFFHMANWLEKVEGIWKNRRTKKSESRFPSVLNRLNYNGLLTTQNPSKKYVVVYNAHGTNIASCVIDKKSLPEIRVLKAKIRPRGFICEDASWYYETTDELEAHFICATLNSSLINEWIKPLQPRGIYGERSIHRRPFILPIPKFEAKNPVHLKLAKLSLQCHSKVAVFGATKKAIAGIRKDAREAVKIEVAEIDELVSQLLGL